MVWSNIARVITYALFKLSNTKLFSDYDQCMSCTYVCVFPADGMGVDMKTEFLKYIRHPRIAEKTEKKSV